MFCPTLEVPNENSSPFRNKQSRGNSYVRSTTNRYIFPEHMTQSIKQWRMIMAPIMQWHRLHPCPPLSHQSRKGGGGALHTASARQIFLPTAASRGKFSPPLRIFRVQPGTHSSTISSVSVSHEAHAASTVSSILPSIRWMRSICPIRLLRMTMLLLLRKHSRIS